jgi:hypothetical protein
MNQAVLRQRAASLGQREPDPAPGLRAALDPFLGAAKHGLGLRPVV